MIFYHFTIYQVGGSVDYSMWGESKPRTTIDKGSILIDDKDAFRTYIQETYGSEKPIRFSRSKKMVDGDLYCIINTKITNNPESQLIITKKKCASCLKEFEFYEYERRRFKYLDKSHWRLQSNTKYDYCSETCKNQHFHYLHQLEIETNDGLDLSEWISRESFSKQGYIYKITKKSSKEFYIGQANTIPIFRWGQHLKSPRFPIEKVVDYKFEIIHIVTSDENINEVEMHYIKEGAMKFPQLILNKSGVKNKNQINLFEEDQQ